MSVIFALLEHFNYGHALALSYREYTRTLSIVIIKGRRNILSKSGRFGKVQWQNILWIIGVIKL